IRSVICSRCRSKSPPCFSVFRTLSSTWPTSGRASSPNGAPALDCGSASANAETEFVKTSRTNEGETRGGSVSGCWRCRRRVAVRQEGVVLVDADDEGTLPLREDGHQGLAQLVVDHGGDGILCVHHGLPPSRTAARLKGPVRRAPRV